jgi:hypothetical protein
MAKERPISKADAAREKGVTRGAVSLACRPGGALERALLTSGRLNSASATYQAWVEGGGKTDGAPTKAPTPGAKRKPKATAKRPGRAPERPEPPPRRPRPEPPSLEELEGYAEMLKPIIDRFGSERGFRDVLLAAKALRDIQLQDLKIQETRGRLISWELVKTHVFGVLESLSRRLLADTPKVVARRAFSLARSEAPVEECEAMVLDAISSQLKPAQENVVKLLRDPADD